MCTGYDCKITCTSICGRVKCVFLGNVNKCSSSKQTSHHCNISFICTEHQNLQSLVSVVSLSWMIYYSTLWYISFEYIQCICEWNLGTTAEIMTGEPWILVDLYFQYPFWIMRQISWTTWFLLSLSESFLRMHISTQLPLTTQQYRSRTIHTDHYTKSYAMYGWRLMNNTQTILNLYIVSGIQYLIRLKYFLSCHNFW